MREITLEVHIHYYFRGKESGEISKTSVIMSCWVSRAQVVLTMLTMLPTPLCSAPGSFSRVS